MYYLPQCLHSDKLPTKNYVSSLTTSYYKLFNDAQLKVRLLYSSGIDLDVLPYKAGKGQALAFVLRKLGSNSDVNRRVLVCGDSGNDIDLFHVDDVYGVIVSTQNPLDLGMFR